MYYVRWVTANEKTVSMRDEAFNTKNEALSAIKKVAVAAISKITEPKKGRIYIVTPKKS